MESVRLLQAEIHSNYSRASGDWSAYNTKISDLFSATGYNATGNATFCDFSDHLVREFNTKVVKLGMPTGLLFGPYDAGYRLVTGNISSFSPLSLFSAGEQGVWYDPSDLTTMFEDSAGTTAVHTPGNGTADSPVGLLLDKSQGLTIGPELITNGDFSNGTTGWSVYQNAGVGTLTVSSGVATMTNSATATWGTANQSFTTIVGAWYKVTGTIVSTTGSTIFFRKADNASSTSNPVNFSTATGTYTGYFCATSTTSYVIVQANDANVSISFDNISVKAVAGNHATQSTSTKRPTLSARYNLLTYTEQFDNTSGWNKYSATITANATTDPLGGSTADKCEESTTTTSPHIIYQTKSQTGATNYSASCYLKAAERNYAGIQILADESSALKRYTAIVDLTTGSVTATNTVGTPTGTSYTVTNAGNGWWLLKITLTATTATEPISLSITTSDVAVPTVYEFGCPKYAGAVGSGVYIWGADLRVSNDGVGLPAYQRVVDANTYDSVGFPYYLKSDGVDDAMQSSAVAINNFALVIGGAKIGTAASGYPFFEQGPNVHTSNGYYVYGDVGYSFKIRKSGLLELDATSNWWGNPNAVVTTYYDLTNAVIRKNASQLATSAYTASLTVTDNFNLFSRNQTSLYSNMRMYGLILCGTNLTATQLANTESWMNGKTKAY